MSRWDNENRDDHFNEATSVTLDPGQKGTITFEPEDRQSDYYLPMLAASKIEDSEYEILTDGTTTFGPAPIPPTDIDDDNQTFIPPETFSDYCDVEISNLGSNTQTYIVQAKGWERRKRTDEGGL